MSSSDSVELSSDDESEESVEYDGNDGSIRNRGARIPSKRQIVRATYLAKVRADCSISNEERYQPVSISDIILEEAKRHLDVGLEPKISENLSSLCTTCTKVEQDVISETRMLRSSRTVKNRSVEKGTLSMGTLDALIEAAIPELEPEPAPEPWPEPQLESEQEQELEPEPEPAPAPKASSSPWFFSKAKDQSEAEPVPQPEPEPESEPELEREVEPEPEPEPEHETKSEDSSKHSSKRSTKILPEPSVDPEPATKASSSPWFFSKAKDGSEPEAEHEHETKSEESSKHSSKRSTKTSPEPSVEPSFEPIPEPPPVLAPQFASAVPPLHIDVSASPDSRHEAEHNVNQLDIESVSEISESHDESKDENVSESASNVFGVDHYEPYGADEDEFRSNTGKDEEDTAVVVVDNKEGKKNYKLYLIIAAVCLVLFIIIIALASTLPQKQVPPPTVAPTRVPTTAPTTNSPTTLSPTSVAPSISFAPSDMPSITPSENPTTSSFAALLDILIPVSSPNVFDDENSPQYRAALWLDQEDEFMKSRRHLQESNMRILQRYALASLYYSVNVNETANQTYFEKCYKGDPNCVGKPGNDTKAGSNFPWLTSVDECWWAFISCRKNVFTTTANIIDVIHFPARGNNLAGTLPYELSLLSRLREFYLPNNQVGGKVASILSQFSTLETLSMGSNAFSGNIPDEFFSKNRFLGTIFFGNNNFNGTISKVISSRIIKQFRLHDNSFSGPIPATFGNMKRLANLQLQNNQLGGPIPNNLYSANRLEVLDLRGNHNVTGEIDQSIHQLWRLERLRLGGTQMGGKIPDTLYWLTELVELDLQNASFSGVLSENIGWLNKSLAKLHLNNNNFSGPIPLALGALTVLTAAHLQGNNFTGAITQEVCDERGVLYQQLASLIVDCQVQCNCCDNHCA